MHLHLETADLLNAATQIILSLVMLWVMTDYMKVKKVMSLAIPTLWFVLAVRAACLMNVFFVTAQYLSYGSAMLLFLVEFLLFIVTLGYLIKGGNYVLKSSEGRKWLLG